MTFGRALALGLLLLGVVCAGVVLAGCTPATIAAERYAACDLGRAYPC